MKTKKKALLTVLCAVMLVVGSVVGTYAYLTDTKEVTNTFTVGNVAITLDEAKVDEYGKPVNEQGQPVDLSAAPRVQANSYTLIPGVGYTKDPTVTILKNSEPCYVRVRVEITEKDALDTIFAPNGANMNEIFPGRSNKWEVKSITPTGDDSRIYELWYKDIVDARESEQKLDPVFTTVVIPGDVITEANINSLKGLKIKVLRLSRQQVLLTQKLLLPL